MSNTAVLCVGKYTLKQEPMKGQGVVSMLAVERFQPGRSAICRFFMNSASFERECSMLSRLPSGEQVPGVRNNLFIHEGEESEDRSTLDRHVTSMAVYENAMHSVSLSHGMFRIGKVYGPANRCPFCQKPVQ